MYEHENDLPLFFILLDLKLLDITSNVKRALNNEPENKGFPLVRVIP
jgi:hypothetical protein